MPHMLRLKSIIHLSFYNVCTCYQSTYHCFLTRYKDIFIDVTVYSLHSNGDCFCNIIVKYTSICFWCSYFNLFLCSSYCYKHFSRFEVLTWTDSSKKCHFGELYFCNVLQGNKCLFFFILH